MADRSTRRELVVSAAVSAAAVSGFAGVEAAEAVLTPEADGELVRGMLRAEHLVVIAYRGVLESGKLEPELERKVRAIVPQELQHVAALTKALEAIGTPAPAPPRDLIAAQRGLTQRHIHTSLTGLHTRNECLKLLIDVESMAEAAYFDAIGKLGDPALLRLSAQIMGCEAQHWTALSAARHHGDVMIAVPYPFVQGAT